MKVTHAKILFHLRPNFILWFGVALKNCSYSNDSFELWVWKILWSLFLLGKKFRIPLQPCIIKFIPISRSICAGVSSNWGPIGSASWVISVDSANLNEESEICTIQNGWNMLQSNIITANLDIANISIFNFELFLALLTVTPTFLLRKHGYCELFMKILGHRNNDVWL